MSSVGVEYLHFLKANEELPRVSYFGRRFTDLLQRFLKIQAALLTNFIDKEMNEQLDLLKQALDRRVTIYVLGHRDITNTDLGILQQSSQSAAAERISDEEGFAIVIITAELENIDHNSETTLKFLTDQFSRSTIKCKLWSSDSRIVKCRIPETICSSLTDNQLSQFRSNIHKHMSLVLGPNVISLENIIVEKTDTNIRQHISDILENIIIESGFCVIKFFLNRFIRTYQTFGTGFVKLKEEPEVLGAIRSFFRCRFSISDTHPNAQTKASFIESLQSRLAKNIKCVVVPLLGKRCNIADSICHEVLQKASFEENLKKALQKNTVYQFEKIYENALKDSGNGDAQLKCYRYDYIVYMLQTDWKEEFERTEEYLVRVISVMKKMTFEIDGYLKQSKKYKDIALQDGSIQLTGELRKMLLSIEGVYGVGNIYGQLEVHIDSEKDFSTVRQSVDDLLNEFNFRHPYSVKLVKENRKS